MNKKKLLTYGVVFVILSVLVYFKFRTWKNFDWPTFWAEWRSLQLLNILYSASLIYFSYFLRALRWKIFLRPVRKQASVMGICPATVIGFTGLALLGRPGELIRPYLIARRENLTFPRRWRCGRWSAFSISAPSPYCWCWRFFCPGTRLHLLRDYVEVKIFGLLFLALSAGLARWGDSGRAVAVKDWPAGWRGVFAPGSISGKRIAQKMREFHQRAGYHPRAAGVSGNLRRSRWGCGFALRCPIFKWFARMGPRWQSMTVSDIFPLMGSSMVGSLIQLPGVGGGSQLATISVLQRIYGVPHELAASCGILLWLGTFVSVIPLDWSWLTSSGYRCASFRKKAANRKKT